MAMDLENQTGHSYWPQPQTATQQRELAPQILRWWVCRFPDGERSVQAFLKLAEAKFALARVQEARGVSIARYNVARTHERNAWRKLPSKLFHDFKGTSFTSATGSVVSMGSDIYDTDQEMRSSKKLMRSLRGSEVFLRDVSRQLKTEVTTRRGALGPVEQHAFDHIWAENPNMLADPNLARVYRGEIFHYGGIVVATDVLARDYPKYSKLFATDARKATLFLLRVYEREALQLAAIEIAEEFHLFWPPRAQDLEGRRSTSRLIDVSTTKTLGNQPLDLVLHYYYRAQQIDDLLRPEDSTREIREAQLQIATASTSWAAQTTKIAMGNLGLD